jgi:hypothetical protein
MHNQLVAQVMPIVNLVGIVLLVIFSIGIVPQSPVNPSVQAAVLV